VEFSQ